MTSFRSRDIASVVVLTLAASYGIGRLFGMSHHLAHRSDAVSAEVIVGSSFAYDTYSKAASQYNVNSLAAFQGCAHLRLLNTSYQELRS